MPAKKAYVILAAPSMQGYGMRSIADWQLALEKIEKVLVPIDQVIEKEPEIPINEVAPEESQPSIQEPVDEEVLDIEESIATGTDPERAFVCGFSISQNPKQLYRRLARKYHPDANKGVDTGLFNILNEVYERCVVEGEMESQEQEVEETDEWGSVSDPESYEKVKKMFS